MKELIRHISYAVCFVFLLLFSTLHIPLSPTPMAQNSTENTQSVEDAHEDLLRDPNYTFTYGQREEIEFEIRETNTRDIAWLAALGTLLTYAFLGACALGIAYLLFLIGRELISVRLAKKERKVETKAAELIPGYKPDQNIANILLAEVDKLAAEGRYDEAVHTLLLRSIQDIRKNKPRSVPPALTSREIGGLPILSANAQTAFKKISALVETSFFGGYALDKAAFETSREAYKSFAFEQGGLATGEAL